MEPTRPAALHGLDHVGLTVPDLDGAADFYVRAVGARQLYRLGPFDARELPRTEDDRDWTEAFVNVADARLTGGGCPMRPDAARRGVRS